MYQNFIIPYLYEAFCAFYKYGIIQFWYIVAICWIFLYELCYDSRIHEHQAKMKDGLSIFCTHFCCIIIWVFKIRKFFSKNLAW
jgi:hypothetical protein